VNALIRGFVELKSWLNESEMVFGRCPACWEEKHGRSTAEVLTNRARELQSDMQLVVEEILKIHPELVEDFLSLEGGVLHFFHGEDVGCDEQKDPNAKFGSIPMDGFDVQYALYKTFKDTHPELTDDLDIELLEKKYADGLARHGIPEDLLDRVVTVYWRPSKTGLVQKLISRVCEVNFDECGYLTIGLEMYGDDFLKVLTHELRPQDRWKIVSFPVYIGEDEVDSADDDLMDEGEIDENEKEYSVQIVRVKFA
jgi:hypothetical protein